MKKTKKPGQVVKQYKENSFLYLVNDSVSAKQLSETLDYLDPENIEVWTEVNLLEIIRDDNTLTLEDIMDNLRKEDKELLEKMSVKQVYACEYRAEDPEVIRKIMKTFLDTFGGKLGSDTEDFEPFLSVKDL